MNIYLHNIRLYVKLDNVKTRYNCSTKIWEKIW